MARPVLRSRLPVGSSANRMRPGDEGAGDGDALLLAAGQLAWQVMRRSPRIRPSAAVRAAACVPDCPRNSSGSATLSSALIAGISWKFWNTKPTACARQAARASSSAAWIGAVQPHSPWLGHPGPASSEQGGLAGTGFADDGHAFAAVMSADAVEDGQLTVRQRHRLADPRVRRRCRGRALRLRQALERER